jgi:hypothetical protein
MPATQVALDLATRSQIVKKLFPIYHLFTERFGMPEPPLSDARSLKMNASTELIESMEKWMDELDRRIDAFQMRSVVQSSNVGASELRILALLERLLGKPQPDSADRSKIDFLLSQLLATRLSLHSDHIPTLQDVAEMLEPVTGNLTAISGIPALESLISELLVARRLAEVKQKSIIERGRHIKGELGNRSLLPENLVACSRFNFMLRKRCFELMKEEVKLIKEGLQVLSQRGAITLNCTAAKLAGAETIDGLMELCRNWQERKPDDYAHDNPFSQVLALQEIVEKAVADDVDEQPEATRSSPAPSAKHVEETPKPTPDVIQIYAELAALRREHQQLAERVERQEILVAEWRHSGQKLQPASTNPMTPTVEAPKETKVEKRASAGETVVASPHAEETSAPAATEDTAAAEIRTTSMQDVFQSLARRMEHIRQALVGEKVSVRKEAPTHLKLGQVSIMLTASETLAFLNPSSQADELICRGAAARFLLLEVSREIEKDANTDSIAMVLTVCEGGASQLQEQAAHLPPAEAERVLETSRLLVKSLKGFSRK